MRPVHVGGIQKVNAYLQRLVDPAEVFDVPAEFLNQLGRSSLGVVAVAGDKERRRIVAKLWIGHHGGPDRIKGFDHICFWQSPLDLLPERIPDGRRKFRRHAGRKIEGIGYIDNGLAIKSFYSGK